MRDLDGYVEWNVYVDKSQAGALSTPVRLGAVGTTIPVVHGTPIFFDVDNDTYVISPAPNSKYRFVGLCSSPHGIRYYQGDYVEATYNTTCRAKISSAEWTAIQGKAGKHVVKKEVQGADEWYLFDIIAGDVVFPETAP